MYTIEMHASRCMHGVDRHVTKSDSIIGSHVVRQAHMYWQMPQICTIY